MRTTVLRYLTSAMLLLALAQGAAFAQGVTRVVKGGVVYEFVQAGNNSAWKCTGYDKSDTSFPSDGFITILSELEISGYDEHIPVTEIVDWAFNDKNHPVDNEDIKGVVINDGIKVIGEYAFNRCVNITNITLPYTIEKVGMGAFHCGDRLRWVDCRAVEDGIWNQQLINEGVNYYGLTDYLMNLEFTLIYMKSWWTTAGTNIVIDNNGNRTCAEFHYSLNMDYCVPYGFTATKISAVPNLAADAGAYSVCLPYSLPIPQGAKAYSLKKKDDNDVYFKRINGDMEAFKPYLIVSPENNVQLGCNDERQLPTTEEAVAQFDTANGVTIHGTFHRIGYTEAAENYYVLQANNEWKLVGGGNTSVTVPPYRAYLTLDGAQAASFYIGFSDDTEGISSPESISADSSSDKWLMPDGRQLKDKPTGKGLYIHGKRKVVVK